LGVNFVILGNPRAERIGRIKFYVTLLHDLADSYGYSTLGIVQPIEYRKPHVSSGNLARPFAALRQKAAMTRWYRTSNYQSGSRLTPRAR
jgi:hypothetical protein